MTNQLPIYRPSQDEINQTLWNACDSFRGAIDSSSYKQYILVMMFVKYLSDYWKDKYDELLARYGNDEELIIRKLGRERFVLHETCTFDYIAANKNKEDIGAIINKALERIEEDNKGKLEGVFRGVDFNSEANLGETIDRNRRLKNLISDFQNPKLNFRPSVVGKADIIGNAYMFLIERFAEGSGKKGGEFYTPHAVSVLLAKLMAPRPGSRIYDPTCGSGSLLITVAEEVRTDDGTPSRDFAIYGQESNSETRALSKMNMFLHELDAARIELGDTINNPKHKSGDALMKFDVVVANPPFSLDKWGHDRAAADAYGRFKNWGVPPKTKGDYAFILHMIASANEQGQVGVIVPHGVLFRGSSEGVIRRKLIDANLLDSVIGLPANLFFGTSIPAAILIFRKNRPQTDVLFIDASRDFEPGKRQNHLRDADINRVVDTYRAFQRGNEATAERYSAVVSPERMADNDYNLNIPRYVDTFVAQDDINVGQLQTEIDALETELSLVRQEMTGYLKELGLTP
ncbi:type I restriction-modification system subunit M [uncultured Fibrella sp.]|uniref:type I restriction-modification system subunit M n=1 Tax=uncultured Fibrella sp. TaxID=1284596 RepID=UPI0035CA00AB